MRVIKTFKDFINEQDGSGGRGVNATKTPPATNTNPKLTTTKEDPKTETPPPAVATTAPDQAIMDKLLKMPNTRLASVYNDTEEKPAKENGVSIDILSAGRSYNFRSKPLTVVVYINDGSGKVAYSGTYSITDKEITTKSTDGKISEVIDIASGKFAIDPTTKQPKSNLPSSTSAADKEKSVAQTVSAAIRANANYWSNSNEDVVHNATEAAIYWIIQNNLNADAAKKFLVAAFGKDDYWDMFTQDAASTYAEMDAWTWGDFGYAPFIGGKPAGRVMDRILNWNPDWASEGDEDTQYLKSKVPSANSLVSYEPVGDDAKKWAETIWSIIDDSWVSADEEVNAIMAVMVLTPKGLLNVETAWKDLQTLGIIDTKLGVDAAIADEVDSPEAGKIVQLFSAALRGTISDGAKKMLELS